MHFRTPLAALVLIGFGVHLSVAQEPIRIQIVPAVAPTPSLEYRFLPDSSDIVPGNAATLYYRALTQLFDVSEEDGFAHVEDKEKGFWYYKVGRWLGETPIGELPDDEIRAFLVPYKVALKDLELASRRQNCDWDLAGRTDGIDLNAFETDKFRQLCEVICLHGRLEIPNNNHFEAIRILRTNFCLAKHLARGPTNTHIVNGLRISRITCDVLREMMETDGAPNLYWALAELPPQFFDIRPAFEFERDGLTQTFPLLSELDKGPASSDTMAELKSKVREYKESFQASNDNELIQQMALEVLYDECKTNLNADDIEKEAVEKMSREEVVLLDHLRKRRAAQN